MHFFSTLSQRAVMLTLLTVGSVCALHATNYYVATNGNNSYTGKTINDPLASVSTAIGKATAGDTIFVRGGTYQLSTTISVSASKSGTAAARICLFGYKGDERPILDFSSMAYGSSNRGFNFAGNYWHIKGIRIKGAGDNGMNMTGSNNIIEFCDFYENRDGGFQLVGGASSNRIINCDSYRNADYGAGINDNGGDADGFSPKMDVGTGNYYYGCRSWLNSDDGWDGYLRGTTTEIVTTLENCWTWKNGYYWKDGTTTSSMNGNGFKQGGSDTKDLPHTFIVKNCLSFYNKANGFDQNSSTGSQTMYNCTSVGNLGRSYYFSSNVTMATNAVITAVNCIAYNNTSYAFRNGSVLTTNNFSTTSTDFMTVDTTGISGPRNADGSLPRLNFMRPAAGSRLIDAGTNVGLPFYGTAPDLGCYEYNPSTGVKDVPANAALRVVYQEGYIQLTFPENVSGALVLHLFDAAGKKLTEVASQTAGTTYRLPVGNIPSQLYICRVVLNDNVYVGRFVK